MTRAKTCILSLSLAVGLASLALAPAQASGTDSASGSSIHCGSQALETAGIATLQEGPRQAAPHSGTPSPRSRR